MVQGSLGTELVSDKARPRLPTPPLVLCPQPTPLSALFLLCPGNVGEKKERPTGVRFGSLFPLLVPPSPHTRFSLQKGEQVLPGALLPHHSALQVRGGGLWGAGGGGRGQDGRAQVEVPGLVPSSNLPLWSYTLVHVSQTHCLPVPLMPGDDQQPMGEVSISRFR